MSEIEIQQNDENYHQQNSLWQILYKKMPGWEELYENYHLSRCLCYASLLVYILLLSDQGFGFNIALILKFELKSNNNS